MKPSVTYKCDKPGCGYRTNSEKLWKLHVTGRGNVPCKQPAKPVKRNNP